MEKNQKKALWIGLAIVLFFGAVLAVGYHYEKLASKTEAPTSTNNIAVQNETSQTENTNWKHYKVNNNTVYYKNNTYNQDDKIVGADASTFQELGDRWAKDKNAVYREGQKQAYLDPATVKVFPYVYVSDKAGVWVYGTGFHMKVDKIDADPSSFSVISHGYGKDKNSIYYFQQKIANADVQSFTLFRGVNYSFSEDLASIWYAKDKNSIYYRSSVIPNANVQSFVYLGDEYAKDKNNVYYEGKVLAHADTHSFVLADGYAKDRNHVFHRDKILNIAIDPASFAVVGGGAIKDNKQVYLQDYHNDSYNLVSNVDAPSFQYVGICESVEMSSRSYFKDKNHVFVENEAVNAIDVLSFRFFGDYGVAEGMPHSVSYAKDKNSVYHSCGDILEDANVSTFADLEDGYAKDKSKIWYLADVISGVHAATFRSLGAGYAKDKSHVYFAGAVFEKADVTTFTLVKENIAANEYGSVYAKDKNYVYSGSEIVKGVNPASCTAESIENCSLYH